MSGADGHPDLEGLWQHLEATYGVEVLGLAELDLRVYRVDRADGASWVARLFPAERPLERTRGDAEILRRMAELEIPAERCAAAEPVSTLDGHSVLVTEFVPGVPRMQRREAVIRAGGLRGVGDLLGRLHALPAGPGVLARPGGAWHHLADGAPQDEIAALGQLLRSAPPEVSAALEGEVARLDDGSGLPESFVHPDFVLANIVAPPTGGLVLVDWTGAGRAPRMWSLAFALWAAGVGGDLSRVERVLAGYRRHIAPEPAELERLEALIRVRPVVFETWAVCSGRRTLDEATAGIAESHEAAAAIAACARVFIAAH